MCHSSIGSSAARSAKARAIIEVVVPGRANGANPEPMITARSALMGPESRYAAAGMTSRALRGRGSGRLRPDHGPADAVERQAALHRPLEGPRHFENEIGKA